MSSKFSAPSKPGKPPPVCRKPPQPPPVPPPWPPKGLCYDLRWTCPPSGPNQQTYTQTGTATYNHALPGYVIDTQILDAALYMAILFTNPERTALRIEAYAQRPLAPPNSSSSSSSSTVPQCDTYADADISLPGPYYPIDLDPVAWDSVSNPPAPTLSLLAYP